MPVPAPATAEIVRSIPVRTGLVNHEATTPTGAAILAAMADEFSEQLDLPVSKIGYGLGNRDPEVANVLRVFLLEGSSGDDDLDREEAILLECNIDDMNPEHYDFLLEKLFAAGASDAWLVPIIMKKSRPAHTLSVLCHSSHSAALKDVIFLHSASIGIRETRLRKSMLRREETVVQTSFGDVRVKQSYYRGKLVRSKPEFDDCSRLATENGVAVSEIEKAVIIELNSR
jgi:uncharacterized protein (DUF111 family)